MSEAVTVPCLIEMASRRNSYHGARRILVLIGLSPRKCVGPASWSAKSKVSGVCLTVCQNGAASMTHSSPVVASR